MATALNNPTHPLAVAVSKMIKNNSQIGAFRALTNGEADAALLDEGELNEALAGMFTGPTEGAGGEFYEGHGPFKRIEETVYGTVGKVLDERGFPKKPGPTGGPIGGSGSASGGSGGGGGNAE
jgi:hypothetical protein